MTLPALDASKFLEDLTGRHAKRYTALVQDMVVAMAMSNKPALRAARSSLEEVITETMGAAEVLGASLVLRRSARVLDLEGGSLFRHDRNALLTFADATTQTILPRVTFDEAVEDMVTRTPITLRRAAERTAQRISQLYSEGRVAAFARSAESAVTERVQGLIAEAIREGIPELDTVARLGGFGSGVVKEGAGTRITDTVNEVRKRTAAWSEGYARMAFRTNVNTAVTAGRFRQAQDQDVKRVIPAFRFDSVGDEDTRPNHDAGDGIIMRVDNLAWNHLAPPLGYSCRCQVSMVSLPELRRLGRIDEGGNLREDRPPSTWHADPGFRHGGRPDLMMVETVR